MADELSNEGTSSSQVVGDSSEATVEINIKTLDSQIYTFRVNKNMPVPLLKEKIANAMGVPVGQQRLIFRGRVLKDDHCLSEYHVEDGHTLHLVARQPVQTQTQPGTSSEETSGNNDNRGNDSTAGAPRNRVGQVSHSVVLGTFNIGDQNEGIVPDLSQIIGTVLNSFGITTPTTTLGAGNSPSTNASNGPTGPSQASQRVQTEGAQNASGSSQTGNQLPPLPNFLPFQFMNSPALSQHMMAIPDSLATLSVFISRMEHALSLNGYLSSPPSNIQASQRSDVPSPNSLGLPTPDSLRTVLERAARLLNAHASDALYHIARRLEREGSSTDPAVRGQIQGEAVQVGVSMQHLGALLLELGRTILTLRMGQSPAESVVNAGPAVYISGSGPNPIMVQPGPLHTSPLFGVSSTPFASAGVPGQVGIVDGPRNVNIHIHAGTSVAAGGSTIGSRNNDGDANRGERSDQGQSSINGNGPRDLGSVRGLPSRTVVAAVPARSPAEAASHVLSVIYPVQVRSQQSSPGLSGAAQGSGSTTDVGPQPNEGSAVSQPALESECAQLVSQINAQIASALSGNSQGQNSLHPSVHPPDALHEREVPQLVSSGSINSSSLREDEASRLAGNVAVEGAGEIKNDLISSHISETGVHGSEGQKIQPHGLQPSSNEDTRKNSGRIEASTTSSTSDLTMYPARESFSGKSTGDSSKHALGSGQSKELLEGDKLVPLGLGFGGLQPKRRSKQPKSQGKGEVSFEVPVGAQNQQIIARGQQVLQSLVSQSSTMSGTNENGSSVLQPSVSGNLVASMPLGGQGVIGSPSGLRRARLQGQNHDLGDMLLGSGRGQGGLDLSGMFQQMMPILSQALGMGSAHPPPSCGVESELETRSNDQSGRDGMLNDDYSQMDLQQAVERIERRDSPGNVFLTVLESACRLYGEENSSRDLVEVLGNDMELTKEFMEMLCRCIHQRLQSESRSTDKP